MMNRYRVIFALVFVLLLKAALILVCARPSGQDIAATESRRSRWPVYEPWFGHPRHISVGYSSQDPAVLRRQIEQAKALGISGFVVDWYGDREPFIDHAYALMQAIAAKKTSM